ncbi:MAG TPA: tRNA uridine-5-carboxymethylaminomethyl(34) synthesis GTPase MnmE [Salinisphaeraceae bacterium]|nr:tRNA uridine-5-carboxymethylaminomethyl(34) synthesis GTPase MnmE [Salinisphaeraceae bacterium]
MQGGDTRDTIAALATPPGRGGVAVIRVSGPAVPAIARAVLGHLPQPRLGRFAAFRDADGSTIDRGLALYFAAPSSFTGEHVLELQGHGSPMLCDLLLARLLALGARLARPGEFSERAFLNDKLSLAQAEAIADAIDAGSHAAARAAMRSLQGRFANQVSALAEALVQLRVYTEAAIDFPDEEVDFLGDGEVQARLEALQQQLRQLQADAERGARLRDGLTVVLAGAPNVGKSSLLNCLAARDSAIVTAVAGTTRDVLREQIDVDGLPLHVVDTAGLRETHDPVEAEGVRRARAELQRADRILLLFDDSQGLQAADRRLLEELEKTELPVTLVANKIDLSGRAPGAGRLGGRELVKLSATSGAGMQALIAQLKHSAGLEAAATPDFIARRRHLDALQRAAMALQRGHEQLVMAQAGELLAEELRLAHRALGEITGEFTSEDLLGAIFSSFCIGK